MTHPLPPAALGQHIAILGKTGSGKSNLAKTIAEDLLETGARVVAIDPTGTWWGLRLLADGTPSPHQVVILGGQHADIPISGGQGEHLAHALGNTLSASNALYQTYVPVNQASIRAVVEARRRGRR